LTVDDCDYSAFFWLLALLLSSCLWSITDALGAGDILTISVCFSVIFQELLRFVVYLLLRKAEAGLEKVSESGTKLVENKHILAYGRLLTHYIPYNIKTIYEIH